MNAFPLTYFENTQALIEFDSFRSFTANLKHEASLHRVYEFTFPYLATQTIKHTVHDLNLLQSLKHPNLLNLWLNIYNGESVFLSFEIQKQWRSLGQILRSEPMSASFFQSFIDLLAFLKENKLYFGALDPEMCYQDEQGHWRFFPALLQAEALAKDAMNIQQVGSLIYDPALVIQRQLTVSSDQFLVDVLQYALKAQKWPFKYSSPIISTLKAATLFSKKMSKEQLSNPIFRQCFIHPNAREKTLPKPQAEAFIQEFDSLLENQARHLKKQKQIQFFKGALLVFLPSATVLMLAILWFSLTRVTPNIYTPELIGLSTEEAEQLLAKKNLNYEIAGTLYHPLYAEGVVVESKPPSGREVKANRLIRVFVSKGPLKEEVPQLLGRSLDESTSILNGFKINWEVVNRIYSPFVEKDSILTQIPMMGESLVSGQAMQLVVSDGFPLAFTVNENKSWFLLTSTFECQFNLPEIPYWGERHILIKVFDQDEELIWFKGTHDFQMPFDVSFTANDKAVIEFYVDGVKVDVFTVGKNL